MSVKVTPVEKETITMTTVALRGIVIYPHTATTFEIGRKCSIKALKNALENDGLVFLVSQKDASVQEPQNDDLIKVGIVAAVTNMIKLSDGNYQVMIEGLYRAERISTVLDNDFLVSEIFIPQIKELSPIADMELVVEARAVFNEYLHYIPKPSEKLVEQLRSFKECSLLSDFIAANFIVNFDENVILIEETDPKSRTKKLIGILQKDIDLINFEGSIQNKVRERLQKQQRDIYLREQLKVIQNELGNDPESDYYEEEDEYTKQINAAKLPDEVREKLLAENEKLAKMPFGTAEGTVIRNYIENCLELPWNKKSKDRLDIRAAERILNEDHEGILKVKQRILEFLAVKQLKPDLKGQILCLVGPPGVGKTSVAKSIARATNRKYARISLGGIRDEAEIRGHRRTYIGSMPGRIINALKLAGTSNPVILLDELDKLTRDSHGDPTAAMLEVLDSEQNVAFRDNFVELPVDLSECFFIATANTTEGIPAALLDRLEIIYMGSYSDAEKLAIAKNHLIPRQLKRHGLKSRQCRISDEAITLLITSYTHENGVRNLEREIASLCRKTAKAIVSEEAKGKTIDAKAVREMLGTEKFHPDKIYQNDEVGIVNGLAWTELGGEMLRIEASSMKGTGKLELTGHLGDVMKESAKAAVSYIRKHSEEIGVDPDFYACKDLHIHVPEGAIPKDGPSAGITIATAIVSELTGRSVRQNIAMTGEITLTGRVLPIGGLKEKTIAAYKCGAKTVIIPEENKGDLDELDEEVSAGLKFITVRHISEVLPIALNEKV